LTDGFLQTDAVCFGKETFAAPFSLCLAKSAIKCQRGFFHHGCKLKRSVFAGTGNIRLCNCSQNERIRKQNLPDEIARPMRIALCLEYPIDQHGGTEVLVSELILGLGPRHQVILVSPDDSASLARSKVAPLVAEHISFSPGPASVARARELAKKNCAGETRPRAFSFRRQFWLEQPVSQSMSHHSRGRPRHQDMLDGAFDYVDFGRVLRTAKAALVQTRNAAARVGGQDA